MRAAVYDAQCGQRLRAIEFATVRDALVPAH